MKISSGETLRAIQVLRIGDTRIATRPDQAYEKASTSVEFSKTARIVQQVKKDLENVPDVREDIVADLRSRVESGEYKVGSDEIADLMLRRWQADQIR